MGRQLEGFQLFRFMQREEPCLRSDCHSRQELVNVILILHVKRGIGKQIVSASKRGKPKQKHCADACDVETQDKQ